MSSHLDPLLLSALGDSYKVVEVDFYVGEYRFLRLRGEVGPSALVFSGGNRQVGGIVFWV